MPLYVYNKTGVAVAIPVVGTLIPLSSAPPGRGPAVNVTSELDGLTLENYTAIQVKVTDGTFDFVWSGGKSYDTPGLTTTMPLSSSAPSEVDSSNMVWVEGSKTALPSETGQPLLMMGIQLSNASGLWKHPAGASRMKLFWRSVALIKDVPSDEWFFAVGVVTAIGPSTSTIKFITMGNIGSFTGFRSFVGHKDYWPFAMEVTMDGADMSKGAVMGEDVFDINVYFPGTITTASQIYAPDNVTLITPAVGDVIVAFPEGPFLMPPPEEPPFAGIPANTGRCYFSWGLGYAAY